MSSAQKAIAGALLLSGALLALVAQQAQQDVVERALLSAWIVLGVVLFFLGVLSARADGQPRWLIATLDKAGGWLGVQSWQIVLLATSLPLVILAHYAAGEMERMPSPVAAWTAWLSAVSLSLIGGWQRGALDFKSRGRMFAVAFGLTLLSLPLRAVATGEIPIILNGDEASAGVYGALYLNGAVNNPFYAGWYSFPGLYFFIPASGIAIFGHTTEALRVPAALAGALTVGGVYLAGRALFDKRTALLAAILLIGFHFHIHFSRIGLNNIWDGFFFALTVGAAWYGWSRENRNALLLAGLGLGLAQYFYPSSRSLLALVYGWLFISALLDRARFKRLFSSLFLMSLTAVVTLLPLAWYYIKFPEQYLAPLQRVSIIGPWLDNEMLITGQPAWKILLRQLWLGVQSFTYLPLQHWYRPAVPLLRPIFATLFILGLIHLILRPRESRTILLVLWLVMFVLLGGLSESTPASQRYVAAAPVCLLLAAYGLSETASVLERLWPQAARGSTYVLLAVAIAASISDIHFYFYKYTPATRAEFAHTNGFIAQRLADYLVNQPDGTQVVFFGQPLMGYYSIPSTQFLAPQVTGLDIAAWDQPDRPQPEGKNLIFVFLPGNESQIPLVQADYPGGTLLEETSTDGLPLYYYYEYSTEE
ncbi:MAG: ArnT family glycosyltransferase [Chloroflexota bacterium]